MQAKLAIESGRNSWLAAESLCYDSGITRFAKSSTASREQSGWHSRSDSKTNPHLHPLPLGKGEAGSETRSVCNKIPAGAHVDIHPTYINDDVHALAHLRCDPFCFFVDTRNGCPGRTEEFGHTDYSPCRKPCQRPRSVTTRQGKSGSIRKIFPELHRRFQAARTKRCCCRCRLKAQPSAAFNGATVCKSGKFANRQSLCEQATR